MSFCLTYTAQHCQYVYLEPTPKSRLVLPLSRIIISSNCDPSSVFAVLWPILHSAENKICLWHESNHELSCFDPFRASQWPSDKATLLTLAPEAGGSCLPALSPLLFYSQSEFPWAHPSHLKPLHIAFGKARMACPENSLSSPLTHYLSTSRSLPSLDIHLKRFSPGKPSWLWRL